MSEKIQRFEKEKCSECDKESVMKITDLNNKKEIFLCEKHYLNYLGEGEIKKELDSMNSKEDYIFWNPKIAKLVFERYPHLTKEHREKLKKIRQQK